MTGKLRKIAVWVIIGLIILAVGSFTFKKTQSAGLNKTADTFTNYVIDGDAKSSFALLTQAAQKQNSYDATWTPFVNRMHTVFANQKPVYVSTAQSGNYSIITYSIAGSDGKYTFTLALLKQGEWKVESFTSTNAQ